MNQPMAVREKQAGGPRRGVCLLNPQAGRAKGRDGIPPHARKEMKGCSKPLLSQGRKNKGKSALPRAWAGAAFITAKVPGQGDPSERLRSECPECPSAVRPSSAQKSTAMQAIPPSW